MTNREAGDGEASSDRSSVNLLLRAALCDRDIAVAAYEQWHVGFDIESDVDPAEFSLLSAVAVNFARHGLPLDDTVGSRIRGINRRTWSANNLRVALASEVIHALNNVGTDLFATPGSLTVLVDVNEVSAVPINYIDITVRSTHAPRAVTALLALGAQSDLPIEPLLDERSIWQERFYATWKGCGVLLRWSTESDPLFETTSVCTLSSVEFHTVPTSERIWSYLCLASEALSSARPTAESLSAVLGLDRTILVNDPQISSQNCAKTLSDRAYRAGLHDEIHAVLAWVHDINPRTAVGLLVDEFVRSNPPPGQIMAEPVQITSPHSAFAYGYRLVAHARVYRAECLRDLVPTTVVGFSRYLFGRLLSRLARPRTNRRHNR